MRPQFQMIILVVFILFSSGCVTQAPNGSWNFKPFAGLQQSAPQHTEIVDIYLATFQSESWDMWDNIRRDPGTRAALSAGNIRIKFLAEGLMLASFGNKMIIGDDEMSLPPALIFEGLLEKDKEAAFAYLDFMSKNRNQIHRELDQTKRIAKNKQLHAKADQWLKANVSPSGLQGLLGSMSERPLNNLLTYWKELRELKGSGEPATTPIIAVGGVKSPSALDKLFDNGVK